MSPILGIYASQISGHLFAPSGAYDSIATTTVGAGGAASITLSSIPSTYTHLQLRIFAQSSRATYAIDNGYIQFNGDTASNYAYHNINGDGASASVAASTSQTSIQPGDRVIGTSVSPGTWGSLVIDILDYANTSKYKTTRALSGCDTNGVVAGFAGMVNLASGLWQSTSAINSIKFAAVNGNLNQYTSVALYGIKGN